MPVFFGLSGLNADLTVLGNGEIAVFTVALVAIASLGKAAGAFSGAWLGGLRFPQALALAAGMNARGSTEIIVASIGLSIGVLSQNLFTMIVAMAFITTTAMPPMLRWALARLPMHEEERKRLDRETIDAQSVLAGWERLLLAADASPTGQLAARFAGLLSGARRMPVTVLSADGDADAEESEDKAPANGDSAATAAIVKASAEGAAAGGDAPAAPIDVVERHHSLPWPEAIAAEAAKGYDLLILGMEPVVDATGDFDSGISRLARSFLGSLAVVSARGRMELKPVDARMQILIPVTGSQVARYGAEMGLALAKAAGTKATALTVILPETRDERPRYSAHARDAGETAKEITAIAEAMEQPLRVAKRTNISPENAILREARLGAHDLIVLGVSRRPGDQLSFGGLAATLLDSSDRSLLFLALQPTVKKESAPAAPPPSSPPPDAKAGNAVRKTDGRSAGSKNGGSKNGVRKKRKTR
jgi:nucleotide-binding universal stress UspA family protein